MCWWIDQTLNNFSLTRRDWEVWVGVWQDVAVLGQLVDDDEEGASWHRSRNTSQVQQDRHQDGPELKKVKSFWMSQSTKPASFAYFDLFIKRLIKNWRLRVEADHYLYYHRVPYIDLFNFRRGRFKTCIEPGYFLLQSKDSMLKTCTLLAGVTPVKATNQGIIKA